MNRFAIFGNEYQPRKSASIGRVLRFLADRKADISLDKVFYDFILRQQELTGDCALQDIPLTVFEGSDFEADYVISMGGDGTFLRAANRVGAKQTPIIGINTGRLGFLADALPSETEQALADLFEGNYQLEEHSVLQVEGFAQWGGALNDIAVLKRDSASMITIRCSVDGEYLVTYQADGLIVSTPTGSTAYSLSNGGPIMVPSARNLCITPVAPHSLNIRPIVVNDSCRITLEVESRSHNFLVAIDGRSEKLEQGTRLTISRAPYHVNIVKRRGQHYFSTLREKLMWGADQREK